MLALSIADAELNRITQSAEGVIPYWVYLAQAGETHHRPHAATEPNCQGRPFRTAPA